MECAVIGIAWHIPGTPLRFDYNQIRIPGGAARRGSLGHGSHGHEFLISQALVARVRPSGAPYRNQAREPVSGCPWFRYGRCATSSLLNQQTVGSPFVNRFVDMDGRVEPSPLPKDNIITQFRSRHCPWRLPCFVFPERGH